MSTNTGLSPSESTASIIGEMVMGGISTSLPWDSACDSKA